MLKPGGKFVLLEHTKCKNQIVGKLQDFFATPYSWVINNCHPNRNPLQILLKYNFDISAKIQHPLVISHLKFAIALKRG